MWSPLAWHGTAWCPPCCHPTTHLLCHILAPLEIVVTIRQDLRLHDGHDAILQTAKQAEAITVMSLGIPQPHCSVRQCPDLRSDAQP